MTGWSWYTLEINAMQSNKKIVVIGGGHGTSVVLASLADTGMELGAVLTMADDGGSTGRLREQLGVSAIGDIRQCLAALSPEPDLADLFSYRFVDGELSGHSVGNLILAAAELRSGSISRGIAVAKKILGIKAEIVPSTEEKCNLLLRLGAHEIKGVHEVSTTDFGGEKPDLYLEPAANLFPGADKLIREADLVIIAPGNFYCSIIPALLVNGMDESINASRAKVVYICNLVNRNQQTDGFKVNDYIDEMNRLSGGLRIDEVIYNTAHIREDCMREGEQQVQVDEDTVGNLGYKLIGREVSDNEKVVPREGDKIAYTRSLARHDKAKLKKVLADILGNI